MLYADLTFSLLYFYDYTLFMKIHFYFPLFSLFHLSNLKYTPLNHPDVNLYLVLLIHLK